MQARILRSNKRDFDCQLLETKEVVVAHALAKQIKGREKHLVVGDNVLLAKDKDTGDYFIQECLERSNSIWRKSVRENLKKSIAANVDVIVVVMSGSLPEYKRGLVDRYLARAVQWEIPAVLVFNKMDEFIQLFDPIFESKRIEAVTSGQFEISAINPGLQPKFLEKNFKDLQALLKGRTAIFLGQSGVGKSKIISGLSGGKVELLSQELGKVGKGTHTTTWAEMIDCGDFWLIDSPGVRSYAMNDVSLDELSDLFPDLFPFFQRCKFRNCEHLDESKGCSFHQLDPDKMEDEIILSRLDSFLRIKEEASAMPEWQKSKE